MTIFFGIFGSLLGSFSNVVILRIGEGRSVIFPPSACPHCHHRLSALDLIPIFGWILLLGKCRYCRAPIAIQYPIVEATAAMILATSYWFWGKTLLFVPIAAWAMIWMILTVLVIREEVTKPGPFLWPLVAYGFLSLWAGSAWRNEWLFSPIIGISAGCLAARRGGQKRFFPWFGLGMASALAYPVWGWVGSAVCVVFAAVFPYCQNSWAIKTLKSFMLLHLALGLAMGIRFGFWPWR